MMLEAVLGKLNNWFDRDANGRFLHVESGELSVEGGSLVGAEGWLQDGQYFRILGSVFNDGLHQYPASGLTDETFTGVIWALAVPKAVLALAQEVTAWQEKNGEAAASPYQSESFGEYQYTRASAGSGGAALGWQDAFRGRLNAWRKLKGVGP